MRRAHFQKFAEVNGPPVWLVNIQFHCGMHDQACCRSNKSGHPGDIDMIDLPVIASPRSKLFSQNGWVVKQAWQIEWRVSSTTECTAKFYWLTSNFFSDLISSSELGGQSRIDLFVKQPTGLPPTSCVFWPCYVLFKLFVWLWFIPENPHKGWQ